MGKSVNDSILDGAFDVLDQANLMIACSAEPLTREQAIDTYALASVVMIPNNDFLKADGDTNGRKVTVITKPVVAVSTSGTATHIALVSDTDLLYVTTCSAQALIALNTIDFPAWDIEISDPV